MTIGIDTVIWGITYAGLRDSCLKLGGITDKVLITKLPEALYWKLHHSLPLGFLSEAITAPHKGFGSRMRNALYSEIKTKLISLMRVIEPSRFPQTIDDNTMAADLQMDLAIHRAVEHYAMMTDTFGRMYYDVGNKVSPAKMDLSFFRSQPYFQELEQIMGDYLKWSVQNAKKPAPVVKEKSSKSNR